MGWTFLNKRWSPAFKPLDKLIENCAWANSPNRKVVAHCKQGSTYYLALRYPAEELATHGENAFAEYVPAEDGSVTIAIIFLTQNTVKEFGWKDMSEGMGPCEAGASLKFLKALSPLQGDSYSAKNAREWRASCERNAKQRELIKKITYGTSITLPEPATFSGGGAKLQEFTVVGFMGKSTTILQAKGRENGRYRLRASELLSATIQL